MFEHPDNKLCAALLNVQSANTLSADEESKLLTLIESSIVARYCGDLERQEDPRGKSGTTYTPLDTDALVAISLHRLRSTPRMTRNRQR